MILRNGKFSGKILRKIFYGKFSTSHHYYQVISAPVSYSGDAGFVLGLETGYRDCAQSLQQIPGEYHELCTTDSLHTISNQSGVFIDFPVFQCYIV
jgi:hypothetical protein